MQGTPGNLFTGGAAEKATVDVPQVTLLSYELQKRGIPLPDGILTREEPVSALGYGNRQEIVAGMAANESTRERIEKCLSY